MGVVPIFPMRPTGVITEINIVEPSLHIIGAVLRANLSRVTPISELTVISLATEGTFDPNHRRPLLCPGVRPRTLFLDKVPRRETLNSELRIQVMRTVLRDRVREAPAGGRRCLKSTIAPTAINKEARYRRFTNYWTAIHRHIHHPTPMAVETDP